MQLSHETIYRSLFVQARGVLNCWRICAAAASCGAARWPSPLARREARSSAPSRSGSARPRSRIAPCPATGRRSSERRPQQPHRHVRRAPVQFVMLVRVGSKDSESVVDALVRQVRRLPEGTVSAMTWDHGTELPKGDPRTEPRYR